MSLARVDKRSVDAFHRIHLEIARLNNASLIQLTTDKKRTQAKQFYERLRFEATHEGMKYKILSET